MTTQRSLILGLTLSITATACGDDGTVTTSLGETSLGETSGSTSETTSGTPPTTDPTTTAPTSTTDTSTTTLTTDPTTGETTVEPDTSTTGETTATSTTGETTVDTDSSTAGETTVETTGTTADDTTTGTTADDTTTGTTADDTTTTTTGTTADDTTTTTTGGETDDEIYAVQNGTIKVAEAVNLEKVVVTAIATTKSGFFAQEPAGGQFSGAWMFVGGNGPDISMLAVGDEVNITGVVAEFNGLTEIDASAGTVVETGVSGIVVAPAALPIATFTDPALAEPWEGVHVQVTGAPLTVSAVLPGDEFQVTDGSNALIDNLAYAAALHPVDFPTFGVGAKFTSIAGPLNYSANTFKIVPRGAPDFTGYAPGPINEKIGVEDLKAGDLVVTEVMYNPTCNNDNCEWFEILNTTGKQVELMGLVVQDNAQNAAKQGKVTTSALVQPGAYVILGFKSAAWPYANPAAAYYAVGNDPALGNGGDQVFLKNATLTIDATPPYVGVAGDSGKSWKLDPTKQNSVDNDVVGNWCYSSAVFFMTEQGSPAALNEALCAVL